MKKFIRGLFQLERGRWTALGVALVFLVACSCGKREKAPTPTGVSQKALRIISHLPALTEIAFALGLGDRIVGVSDFCHTPEEVNSRPRVGGVLNPNLERALALRPDLVLLLETQKELIRRYEALSVPWLGVKLDSLEDLYDAIGRVGHGTGTSEAADSMVQSMRRGLEEVRESVREARRPGTLLVIGHQPGALRDVFVAGPESYLGALLDIAGGENIFGDLKAAYPKISLEEVLDRDPEIIIVISSKSEISPSDTAAERQAWSQLFPTRPPGLRRIVLLPAEPFSIPGPRAALCARGLARIIHETPATSPIRE